MANSRRVTPVLLLALIGIVVIALAEPITGNRWDQGNTTGQGNSTGQDGVTILGNATLVTVQGNMTVLVNNIVQPQDVPGKDEAKDEEKEEESC